MIKPEEAGAPGASIALVERDTGLSKDTLRVWEKRYGFPVPRRDANGERVYPPEQVEKLRLLRRLMDGGCRPGKIVPLDMPDLAALADQMARKRLAANPEQGEQDPEITEYLRLLREHQVGTLSQTMTTSVLKRGLERFVIEVAGPLCVAVGDAWARGDVRIFEEHIFTEQLTHVMRTSLAAARNSLPTPESGRARPRVLLTTFPQEQHALGLLMAEVLMTLNGCSCVSLGTQTPIPDIVQAAQAQQADIIALSCSVILNPGHVTDNLLSLRRSLGPEVEIWVGGQNPALGKRSLTHSAGIRLAPQLHLLSQAVAEWRAQRV